MCIKSFFQKYYVAFTNPVAVVAVKMKALSSLKDQLEKGINRFSSILDSEASCQSFENVDIEVEQGDFQNMTDDNRGDDNDDRELQEATQDATIEPQELDEDVIKGIGNDIIEVEECRMEKISQQSDRSSEIKSFFLPSQ